MVDIIDTVHVFAPERTPEMMEAIGALRAELAYEFGEDCYDLNSGSLHRFLMARNLDLAKAKAMARNAIMWRQRRAPRRVRVVDIEPEAVTGKCYNPGFDRHGRPVLVLDNTKENTWNIDQNMTHLAWQMERCVRQMGGGVQKILVFIKLEEFAFRTIPPLAVTKETIQMLSNYYPERLGHCVLFKGPRVFSMFFDSVKHFIDRKTASKAIVVKGNTRVGSVNDNMLIDLIGDDWRTLTGVNQPVYNPGCSPGYDHAKEWLKVQEEEQRWLQSEAEAAEARGSSIADGDTAGAEA